MSQTEMSSFPNELPPRPPQSYKQRHHCTNPRSCLAFTGRAYNIFTKDKPVLARRLCTLLILLTRITLSVFDVYAYGYFGNVLAVGTVLALFTDLGIIWPLAVICEARGERKLFGLRIVSHRPEALMATTRRKKKITQERD